MRQRLRVVLDVLVSAGDRWLAAMDACGDLILGYPEHPDDYR